MASIESPPTWQYSPALQAYYYVDDRDGQPRMLVTSDGRRYPVDRSISRTVEEVSDSSSAAGPSTGESRLDSARGYRESPGPARTQPAVRHNAPATNFAPLKVPTTTPGTPRRTPASDRIPPGNLDYTPSSSQVKSIFSIAPPRIPAKSRPRSRTDTLLDEDFKVRQDPQEYFIPGKVFMVLWAESAKANSEKSDSGESADSILEGRNRELVFSQVRRFIVIRAGHMSCSALQIVSHAKSISQARAHGIVHTGEPRYAATLVTHDLTPQAVRIFPDASNDSLDPASRINYEQVYTVEHNLKVKSFGKADDASTAILLRQFREFFTAKLGPVRDSRAETARRLGRASGKISGSGARPALSNRNPSETAHDLGSLTTAVGALDLTERELDAQSTSDSDASAGESDPESDEDTATRGMSQSTPNLHSSLATQDEGSRSKSTASAFETLIDGLQRAGYTRQEAVALLRQASHARGHRTRG